MRIRFIIVIGVLLIVVVAIILAYPYITFKPPELINTQYWISSQSTILSVVFYLSMEIRNPNPYPITLISTSMTVSFNDGVTVMLQPEYVPVEFGPYGINYTLYVGSLSLSQLLQLGASPPTSYTVTWQATYTTPLGSKTITCLGTVFIQTNQTTYTCTE